MAIIERIKQSLLGYWEVFLDHVPNILFGLFILVLAFLVARWLSILFQRRIGSRMADPLVGDFISRILRFVLVLLGILLAFHIMGLTHIAGGLLAGAGLGALIIGLAFQEIGANFLAGIILAFNRPFHVGDTIAISGHMGRVVVLNLRNTHIKTFDGMDIYIPNNNIVKNEVINYTRDGFLRQGFIIGLDYNEDIEAARQVIFKAIKQTDDVLRGKGQEPLVVIKELTSSTVNIEVKFWLETFDYKQAPIEVRSQVIASVLKELVKGGFGLPSDILELKAYRQEEFPVKLTADKRSQK